MIHSLRHGLQTWVAALRPQASQFIACGASSRLILEREWPDAMDMARAAPTQKYLGHVADLVAEAMQQPRQARSGRWRQPNDLGHMPCRRCGRFLLPSEFRGRCTLCRRCDRECQLDYGRTLRGFASRLASNANRRGRMKGLPGSIERKDVLQMLLHQQGRCAYSRVPMEIQFPHSHWRGSLERVSNWSGYSRENCILVAAEFNTSDQSRRPGVKPEHVHGTAQWSIEKFLFVANAWNLQTDFRRLEKEVSEAVDDSQKTGRSSANLLRNKCKRLARDACRHAVKRGHPCEIRHADILQKLLEQEGRCFYSGVPLQYMRCHDDWVVSLERLDNNVGYTVSNTVLIAAEFNTSDNTGKAARESEVTGSSQWSLAKVMHVWGRAGFLKEQPPAESIMLPYFTRAPV